MPPQLVADNAPRGRRTWERRPGKSALSMPVIDNGFAAACDQHQSPPTIGQHPKLDRRTIGRAFARRLAPDHLMKHQPRLRRPSGPLARLRAITAVSRSAPNHQKQRATALRMPAAMMACAISYASPPGTCRRHDICQRLLFTGRRAIWGTDESDGIVHPDIAGDPAQQPNAEL